MNCFLAIHPTHDQREYLFNACGLNEVSHVFRTLQDDLHITIGYISDITDGQLADLRERFKGLQSLDLFSIKVGAPVVFSRGQTLSTAESVASTLKNGSKIAHIVAEIESETLRKTVYPMSLGLAEKSDLTFNRSGHFKPHITIGHIHMRHTKVSEAVQAYEQVNAGYQLEGYTMDVSSLALMRRNNKLTNRYYETLDEYPLLGTSGK